MGLEQEENKQLDIPIVEFTVNRQILTEEEKSVLVKMEEAGRLIITPYLLQENNQYPGANFYPPDATEDELLEAARGNPQILSPYTVVERDQGGKLVPIPFHRKYQGLVEPVAQKLQEAAEITSDQELADLLKARAQSFLDDSWQESEIVWLKCIPKKIQFVIGPIESYLDNLFGIKTAYDCYCGIVDEEATDDVRSLKDAALTLIPNPPKVDVAVIQSTLFAGFMARIFFTATNLPNDPEVMDEHGSKITVCMPSFEQNFQKHLLFVKSLFAPELVNRFTQEELRLGDLRRLFMHEVSHSLVRHPGGQKRLLRLYATINEFYSTVMGVKLFTFLSDMISEKELEVIFLMQINRGIVDFVDMQKTPGKINYAQGEVIGLNFYLEKSAIEVSEDGVTKINTDKMIEAVRELSEILDEVASRGGVKEAQTLIDEYGSFRTYQGWSSKFPSSF